MLILGFKRNCFKNPSYSETSAYTDVPLINVHTPRLYHWSFLCVCVIFFIFTARCWEVYRHRKALPLPEVAFWSQQWQWQKVCHKHTLYSSFPLLLFVSHTHGCFVMALITLLALLSHCLSKIHYPQATTQFRLVASKLRWISRFIFAFLTFLGGGWVLSSCKVFIHFSAVWLIIIMKQTTDLCRLLLYLAVCVSFVSPYLFITPTPQFCPFGLRMRGGPPLLDYGIKKFLY